MRYNVASLLWRAPMAGAMVQRAVLYRRVSTEEQVENTSLAEQLAACRRKAESINAQIVEEYADEGISGGLLTGRPGLQAAIKAIEDGVANVLIVYNLSRLSRDRRHQLIIKDAVETAGGRILFCDMQFDN